MKFNSPFYDRHLNFDSTSKKKLILSIIIGLISAILIYCFFYTLRETERMMTLDLENRPLIITEENRSLFNLFFAAISVAVGNSIAISFFVSRSQNLFSRRNYKRSRIINDQAFLVPSFMYWFTKIWFLFGAFAFEFFGMEFLDYFILPSVLLIIVLFLDSWKSLILIIRRNRWKIQFFHLICFLTATFVLSQIDAVDYKSIDDKMLALRPSIDVPSSTYKNVHKWTRDYERLVFKMKFDTNNEVILLNEKNEPIQFNELVENINEHMMFLPEEHKSRLSPRLRADKNVPIEYVKLFELILLDYGVTQIIYEVENDDEFDAQFFNQKIRYYISPSLQEAIPQIGKPPRVFGWDFYKQRNFKDTLKLNISKSIKIDNQSTSTSELSKRIKSHINNETIIEYVYSKDVTYQDYINILSAHKNAVKELRDTENYSAIDGEYQRNQFFRDEKLKAERKRIKEKYPLNITERFD